MMLLLVMVMYATNDGLWCYSCAFRSFGLEELGPGRGGDQVSGFFDCFQDGLDGVDHIFGDELQTSGFLDAIQKLDDAIKELGAETPEIAGVAYLGVVELDGSETRLQNIANLETMLAAEYDSGPEIDERFVFLRRFRYTEAFGGLYEDRRDILLAQLDCTDKTIIDLLEYGIMFRRIKQIVRRVEVPA